MSPKVVKLDNPWSGCESWGYWVDEKRSYLHREDGPAQKNLFWPDSRPIYSWYLYGNCYDFDHWCVLTHKTPEEKMILQLKYPYHTKPQEIDWKSTKHK